MSIDAIRSAICSVINGVPSAGVVLPYEAYETDASALAGRYMCDVGSGVKRLRGWNVRRRSTEELQTARRTVTHIWELRHYAVLSDGGESEVEFDERIETVRAQFRVSPTLGGVVTTIVLPDGTAGLQVAEAMPVMFCGQLCHYARLTMATRSIS